MSRIIVHSSYQWIITCLSFGLVSATERILGGRNRRSVQTQHINNTHQRANLPEAWSAIWMGVMNGPWVC